MNNVELRDYLAGQALQGFIAANKFPRVRPGEGKKAIGEIFAEDSYLMADYMLKAREITTEIPF